MERLPLYKVEVGDGGVTAVSLVEYPAVESDFLLFEKDKKAKTDVAKRLMLSDEKKHRVLGCVLRADFPIYRRDDDDYEYNIVFSRESIEQLSRKMFKSGSFGVNNAQHTHSEDLSDKLELIQMFIKDSKKGIVPDGFGDIADGSLFAEYQVLDDGLWKDIEDGKMNGFSVECSIGVVRVDRDEEFVLSAINRLRNAVREERRRKGNNS